MKLKKCILAITVFTIVFALTACAQSYNIEDFFKADTGYGLKGLEYGMNPEEVEKKLSVTMNKVSERLDKERDIINADYSCTVKVMDHNMKLLTEFVDSKLVSTIFVLEDEVGLEKKYAELCEKLEKSIELSDEQKVDSVQDGSTLYSSQVFRRADHANGTSIMISGFQNAEGLTEKIEISLNTINNM